jgi:hypothetical protein
MAGKTYDADLLIQGGLQVPAGGYISAVIDCSVDNISDEAVWQAFSLPAGCFIHEGGAVCLTAEGGTLTIDVGFTGGTVDLFLDGSDMNVANAAYSSAAAGSPSYLSSADTIDVLFKDAADAAKILIYARYTKVQ